MSRLRDEFGKPHNDANPVPVDIVDATGVTINVDVNQVNDGDSTDTTTDGPLIHGSTAVPGVAKAIRTDTDGQLQIDVLSSALPAGASTEVSSAALLTELELKADLSETQPVSASSLPLPSGASTETTLASLLTELQLKANLSETQPVSAASLPLPAGASTLAAQLADGHNVTVDNATSNAVPVEGRAATGTAITGNPFPIGVRDLTGQVEYAAGNDLGGSISTQFVQPLDAGLISVDYNSNGSTPATGDTLHDSVDSGFGPMKIGGRAIDYEPDTDAEQGRGVVATGDRVDGAYNLRGEAIEGVNSRYHVMTNVSTTYNNTTTTATSDSVECWNYREATISYALTKANAPTDILIQVQTSMDGTAYSDATNGALGAILYDDVVVGSGIERNYTFKLAANFIRINIIAAGTTASATFTIADFQLFLRN